MKVKLMIFFLVFLLASVSCTSYANDYYDGKQAGKDYAEKNYSTDLDWILGTPHAFLSPITGACLNIGLSYMEPYNIDSEKKEGLSNNYSNEYISGFEEGYKEKAKSMSVNANLGATALGISARLIIESGESGMSEGASYNKRYPLSISFQF